MIAPKDIVVAFPPLMDTLGRAELELAAAIVVSVCQRRGSWGPVSWEEIKALAKDDLAKDPKHWLWTRVLCWPDAHGLVDNGFAVWVGDDETVLELTQACIRRIVERQTRRWFRSLREHARFHERDGSIEYFVTSPTSLESPQFPESVRAASSDGQLYDITLAYAIERCAPGPLVP